MKRGAQEATPLPGGHRALPTRFGGFGTAQRTSTLSYLSEPPSVSAVSDPHVVVLLKNILKKDSTTKGRALEELVGHVQSVTGGIEDALIEVWVQIYPRVSIDNARRVRELAHTLQFELLKSGRKRMERRLSGVVATWIAGLFDRDRSVSRSANIGLTSFLNTPEKLNTFWLKCQSQILDFAIESIRESPDTLSDERSTTPEDAEAKYFRVIYASLCLVNGLLQRASDEDITRLHSQYEDYFQGDIVWANIRSSDSSVRKAVCHLMFACLDRKLPYVDTKEAISTFLVSGLQTVHTGTALEYVRALSKLTEAHPSIWTSVQGRKSPFTRLRAFIAQGSQGSPPAFWERLDHLLDILPDQDGTLKSASELLSSIQSGITHRDEHKTNTSSAWKCYIDTAKRLLLTLSPNDQLSFASEHLFPLFERFVFSAPGSAVAIPLGPNSMAIFVEAQTMILQGAPEVAQALEEEWGRLGAIFCSHVSAVLPEVSKDFQKSQERLGEEGRRWFGLVGELERASSGSINISRPAKEPSTKVIGQCLELLRNRDLKPYGAARVIEFALSTSKHLFVDGLGQQILEFLSASSVRDMQHLIESPSASSLFSSLWLLKAISSHQKAVAQVWNSWIGLIVQLPPSAERENAIISIVSSDDASEIVQNSTSLQEVIVEMIRNGSHSKNLLDAALSYKALSHNAFQTLAHELIQTLGNGSSDQMLTLELLERLVRADQRLFVDEETTRTELVRKLLGLEESKSSDISAKASSIRSSLGQSSSLGLLPVVGIIQQNLEVAGPQCLGVDTLVRQAQAALQEGASAEEVYPSTNSFMQALLPFLQRPLDPSLAIMNITGGLALWVKSEDPAARPPPRDSHGRSIPVRMALYLCHLRQANPDLSELPDKFQIELLYLQALVSQMASDEVSLRAQGGLWDSLESPEITAEAEWLVSTSRRQLLDLTHSCVDWSNDFNEDSRTMPQLVDFLINESKTMTPTAFYSSRVLADLIQDVVEHSGIPSPWEEIFLSSETLKVMPNNIFVIAAALSGFGNTLRSSKHVNFLCNRLVSDIAAASISSEKTATILALFSLCGGVYDTGLLPVPSNRIVFGVKRIADWFEDEPEMSPEIASECVRCLALLLPCIKDVYGSFWEKTLQFCITSWESAHQYSLSRVLPLLQASLKLIRDLQEIEDSNDDLEESLATYNKQKGPALVGLLRLDRDVATQSVEIVDRLLCREVERLSISQFPEPDELYSLVASESEAVQTAAYSMLHRILPEKQQRRSVEILLDKSDARLPDELLSLLLDAPTLDQFTDDILATFPASIRGYLLAWKLIFDAYGASPFKIRMDFTEGLKAENPLAHLLDFMFDVLGHSAGYPLKLEKEKIYRDQIKDWSVKLADAEPEEKSMHWLMAHLFYLTLKYVPGLFRTWFQDCHSKQTKMAVESWTEMFFSPLIIEDALDDVQSWADSADFNSSNEAEIIVKVSKSGKEVSAMYEIDESEGGMAVKLPTNFPIEGVTVRGIRRVAVNERKWQSWIMTTQGVITFSNGNVIDGLQAFRRNLTGALRGHSECAICYSVISADQRVPEKSCTTCKNIFHRLCLYKWFQTSNNNTCPLCRTPIDFAGASNLKRRGNG